MILKNEISTIEFIAHIKIYPEGYVKDWVLEEGNKDINISDMSVGDLEELFYGRCCLELRGEKRDLRNHKRFLPKEDGIWRFEGVIDSFIQENNDGYYCDLCYGQWTRLTPAELEILSLGKFPEDTTNTSFEYKQDPNLHEKMKEIFIEDAKEEYERQKRLYPKSICENCGFFYGQEGWCENCGEITEFNPCYGFRSPDGAWNAYDLDNLPGYK